MDAELLQAVMPYVVMLLTLGFLGYFFWKRDQPLDTTNVIASLEEARSEAEELARVSLTAVQAAEQLWRSGTIDRDARWHEAVAYIRRWYPEADAEIIAKNVEAAVLVVNSLTRSLPKKEE